MERKHDIKRSKWQNAIGQFLSVNDLNFWKLASALDFKIVFGAVRGVKNQFSVKYTFILRNVRVYEDSCAVRELLDVLRKV